MHQHPTPHPASPQKLHHQAQAYHPSAALAAASAQSPHAIASAHEPAPRRTEPRRQSATRVDSSGYTIAHAGRQVRFGPVVFWITVGTVVIMASWSIASATYLAFRDDVLRTLIAHQAQQQFAYEDRIAELRAQIDRNTSRQLLDQEQFEQKLEELSRRESLLESRSNALGAAGDPTITGTIRPSGMKPSTDPTAAAHGKQSNLGATMGHLEATLDRVERRQALALHGMEDRLESKVRLIRGVYAQLGLKPDVAPSGIGGPFVPVKLPADNETFERGVLRVNLARTEADRLNSALVTLPIRKPVTGEIDLSSPFGVRMDPFLHEAAMHTGLDFRGDLGEQIHATAAGTVTIAGWSGGYGKMVEVDHGNGLATRYGHLSAIEVKVGDRVKIGQVVGRLGSTGRSTGPHLHYETRIDGDPVNPQKFLDAGARLFGDY